MIKNSMISFSNCLTIAKQRRSIIDEISKICVILGCFNSIVFISGVLVFVYSGYYYAHIVLSILLFMVLCKIMLDVVLSEKHRTDKKILLIYVVVLLLLPVFRYAATVINMLLKNDNSFMLSFDWIYIKLHMIVYFATAIFFTITAEKIQYRAIYFTLIIIALIVFCFFGNITIYPFKMLSLHSKEASISLGSAMYFILRSVGYIVYGSIATRSIYEYDQITM